METGRESGKRPDRTLAPPPLPIAPRRVNWVPSSNLDIKKEMKEALEAMDPLPGWISEVLLEAGPGRVTSDGDRRGLVYMEKELSTIVAALRQLTSAELVPAHVDSRIKDRLAHLRELASWTRDLLVGYAPGRQTEKTGTTQFPKLNLTWIEQLLLVDAAAISTAPVVRDDPQLPPPSAAANLHLVGIDGPRKKLLRWLMDGDEEEGKDLKVISVVGPAGVGKTTLAMEVYSQISEQFQCRATAKMPRGPPDAEKLLKHIMSQITDSAALGGDDYLLLVYNMEAYLQDKRYLILIDDVRKISDWEIIEEAFPKNEYGSRIIITSPFRSVARCCSRKDGLVHEVKPLGELDSERLFTAKAFGSNYTWPSDHLRQVSDEVLRRCDGIPLFIIVMAVLMKQERAVVLNKSASYWLDRVPELKQVEEAFSPIYDDLPHELKLLSLYMSTFPWGYKIDKHRLISKWRAEGLIAPDLWRTFEETAEEYFSELLDKDIIRLVTSKYNSEAETCCQVDYFTLQFLVSESARKCFLTTSHTINSIVAAAGGGSKTRMLQRLSLHQSDPDLPVLLERTDLSLTRSLTVSGAVNRIPLDKFIHLVMLDLEGWDNLKDDDLVQICSDRISRVKYLSVRNTRVSKLPSQIRNLGYLETLDINHTQITELPSEVEPRELPELCTLDLRGTQVRLLPPNWLPCLRHLLVNGDKPDEIVTEIPEHIVRSDFLETLATVDLSKWSAGHIKDLARLRFLEVLAVTWSFHQCYNTEYQEALRSAIQSLGCLKSLTIQCELGCSMEFLDSLSDAPQDLQNLVITAGFLTVPKWIQGLNHLSCLQITVCKLLPDDLKLLGSLHRMECLVLGLDFLPKEVIVIQSGFHQLLRLSVDCRVALLNFREGAMPMLTNLDLKLSTGPTSHESVLSGIGNLASLEQVTVRYDPWYINSGSIKATVRTIRRQVAELQYIVKLVNNGMEEDVEAILDEETTETTHGETKSEDQLP